jgi:hypothetical protein
MYIFRLISGHIIPDFDHLLTHCYRGNAGDEVIDEGFHFANARRRSNSSSFTTDPASLKSKFEVNDPEPVFEESLHGAAPEDDDLSKTETSSSGGSMDEEKAKEQ